MQSYILRNVTEIVDIDERSTSERDYTHKTGVFVTVYHIPMFSVDIEHCGSILINVIFIVLPSASIAVLFRRTLSISIT